MSGKTSLMSIAAAMLLSTASVADDGRATADEVVAKVHKAAALLRRNREAGIARIADARGEFVWKDTYVFVVNCSADLVVANPRFPERVGGDILQHTDYAGFRYGETLCKTAAAPRGGWVDYTWLRPGHGTPERKSSFVIAVPGTPLTVGAGIYPADTADGGHSEPDKDCG